MPLMRRDLDFYPQNTILCCFQIIVSKSIKLSSPCQEICYQKQFLRIIYIERAKYAVDFNFVDHELDLKCDRNVYS